MMPVLVREINEQGFEEILDDENAEELADMGSFNHGYIQMRLGSLIEQTRRYTPVSELTLDVSGIDVSQFGLHSKEEIKPDICVYSRRGLSRPQDILKMNDMPLLAIEIVSPRQGLYDLINKFRVYFVLGIQSCWLVEPTINAVSVYTAIDRWETYTRDAVIDEKLNLHIPVNQIFG
jgi:Uma2 family endonuclease